MVPPRKKPKANSARGALAARLNTVAILASVLAFTFLVGASMSVYPGGTWWDASSTGHRFWENFLCDLERRIALSGEPNPLGSTLAVAGLVVLGAGLGAFWLGVARVIERAGKAAAAKAVRVLGVGSAAAAVAAVTMPSDRFGELHAALVLAAGVPGLGTALLATGYLAAAGARASALLGVGTVLSAGVDIALYAAHVLAHVEGTPLVVVVQKIALGLLLAWMLSVAART